MANQNYYGSQNAKNRGKFEEFVVSTGIEPVSKV